MSEKLDRAAAKERCEKATPGPIQIDRATYETVLSGHRILSTPDWPGLAYIGDRHNAEFFAHARTDLPLALAELDAKDAEIQTLREAIKAQRCSPNCRSMQRMPFGEKARAAHDSSCNCWKSAALAQVGASPKEE